MKRNKTNTASKTTTKVRNKRKPKGADYEHYSGDNNTKPSESKYNGWDWYAKNQQQLIGAASFSYNTPLGDPLPWDSLVPKMDRAAVAGQGISGIAAFCFVPGIGRSANSTSPANLAAQNIYSYVRYMNSGAKNYDPADLMLYMMTFDSIYMMWNWMKRIYGYCNTYSAYNRYMPRAYAEAENIDFDDVSTQLADFRLMLNQFAARISSFCVPGVMPIFVRHSWLVSNIYKDSDTYKAQQYLYTPAGYYVYDETSSKFGGQLVWNDLIRRKTKLKLVDLRDIMNAMLDAIAYSEDVGVMSGDILKAYGQDKLFTISPIEADYTVLPVYNTEVLNQMHNATLHGYLAEANFSKYNITQNPDTGYLVYNPRAPKGSNVNPSTSIMINMQWDDVTPANTMVGTRLSACNIDDGDSGTYAFYAIGSEFICREYVITFIDGGHTIQKSLFESHVAACDVAPTAVRDQIAGLLGRLSITSQFDWHPLLILAAQDKSQSNPTFKCFGMFGDVNNYTVLSQDNLKELHTTALLSEFNVPQIGSY